MEHSHRPRWQSSLSSSPVSAWGLGRWERGLVGSSGGLTRAGSGALGFVAKGKAGSQGVHSPGVGKAPGLLSNA